MISYIGRLAIQVAPCTETDSSYSTSQPVPYVDNLLLRSQTKPVDIKSRVSGHDVSNPRSRVPYQLRAVPVD